MQSISSDIYLAPVGHGEIVFIKCPIHSGNLEKEAYGNYLQFMGLEMCSPMMLSLKEAIYLPSF